MKNVFVAVGLIFALISVNHIWAQDETNEPSAERVVDVAVDVKENKAVEQSEDKDGVMFGIEFKDDDASGEESLDRIADVVREVAGNDVADDIVVELDGMTAEEKAELVKALREGFKFDSDDIPPWVGTVAILAVILFLLGPVLILIAVFSYGYLKRRQKMEIIQVHLDAGKDVPPQVLSTFDSSGGSFRSGLILTGAGIGIVAAFNSAGEPSTGALGLIPLFIGIAKLLYWMFEERKHNKN